MPLNPEDGKALMIQGFYDKVLSILGRAQSCAEGGYGLMMSAVDYRAGSVQLEQEGPSGSLCSMNSVSSVPGMDR